jgi:hypothetical protein
MKTSSYTRPATTTTTTSTTMTSHNRVVRKRKAVKFQDRPPEVMTFSNDTLGSSWHSAETLAKIKNDAIRMAIDAYSDPRHAAWNAIFQENENDLSCELLSMWTTNFNSLRGLERHVCAISYGRRRMNEHYQRTQAVLQAQQRQKQQEKQFGDASEGKKITSHDAEASSMELATISRACSYPARILAIKMGKADAIAVSEDVMKSIKLSHFRLMTMKAESCLHLSGHDLQTASRIKCGSSFSGYGTTISTKEIIPPSIHQLAAPSPTRSTVA